MKQFFSTKTIAFGVGVLASLLLVVSPVLGIDLGLEDLVTPSAEIGGFETADETTFAATIGQAVRAGISLLGIIFTLLVVYAGMRWMLARGNESEVEDAQKILRNAIIGLLLAVGSYAITNYVIQIFGA